ncbi:MAG: hypothetical protein JSR78_03545 [Proteobacteria bacterium]|nr:hypothetical protein [Pseudomonadota bacterium]
MDIAPFISFGDRYLHNQFYFIVTPSQLALMGAIVLLPPWLGVSYAGATGFWWGVGLQLLGIASLQGYTLAELFLRIGQDDTSDAAFRLFLNLTAMQLMTALLSAAAAWLWLRSRRKGAAKVGR